MKRLFYSYNKTQNGFTLLELVIVIVCIGFLGLIVLDRVWKYRIYDKIALLNKTNPLDLFLQKPNNYLGEIKDIQSIKEKGVWYFDKSDKSLSYIVSYPENFQTSVKGIKRTRHQLQLVYKDNNNNKRFDKGIDDINGLDMIKKEYYRWLVEK